MAFSFDVEAGAQGGIDWLMARVGHCTASRFGDVMDKLKSGKPGAAREKYLWELVIERLTGQPSDHYASTAMQWGTENEPAARMAYEAQTGSIVEEVGFTKHATLPWCGGSADGLVGAKGLIECKCPYNSANHLRTVLGGMPEEHMAQVQGNLWLNNREWADFISFDPRLPGPLQLYVQRVERENDYLKALEAEVQAFLVQADELHSRILHTWLK